MQGVDYVTPSPHLFMSVARTYYLQELFIHVAINSH